MNSNKMGYGTSKLFALSLSPGEVNVCFISFLSRYKKQYRNANKLTHTGGGGKEDGEWGTGNFVYYILHEGM